MEILQPADPRVPQPKFYAQMRRIWDSNKREKKRRGNATCENGKKEEELPRLKSNWREGEQSQVFPASMMKLLQQSVCQKFRELKKSPLRASM